MTFCLNSTIVRPEEDADIKNIECTKIKSNLCGPCGLTRLLRVRGKRRENRKGTQISHIKHSRIEETNKTS